MSDHSKGDVIIYDHDRWIYIGDADCNDGPGVGVYGLFIKEDKTLWSHGGELPLGHGEIRDGKAVNKFGDRHPRWPLWFFETAAPIIDAYYAKHFLDISISPNSCL